ncbi:hypothetical protein BDN70DRAFT_765161, partial [Pholiota conissans]
PAKLCIDNQSAISVAKNPEHHVALQRMKPIYLPTEDMPADLLTKALAKPQVEKLRKMIGLV